jgi:hypothetical protein
MPMGLLKDLPEPLRFERKVVASEVSMLSAFHRGLREAGYAVGKNAAIEFRWGDGHYDRLRALAEDLVHQNVSIIVTTSAMPILQKTNRPKAAA